MREGLSDRTIFAAGITAGIAAAVLSLFSPAPGRVVEKVTGIGAPAGPSLETRAITALRNGDFPEAIKLFTSASKKRPDDATVAYNLACALSLGNHPERAVTELERSVALGFSDSALIRRDEDFANIRGSEAFDRAVARTTSQDPRHQLDFLVGAWDICNEDGTPVARSEWVRWHNGALYMERRRGRAFRSTWSYSFDSSRMVWMARAVTDEGITWEFEGKVVDGALILDSAPSSAESGTRRITFRTEDDGTISRITQMQHEDKSWRVTDTQAYAPGDAPVWDWESD